MSFVDIFILALATWRISSLFVDERGPFDIFVKVRSWTGITHDQSRVAVEFPDTFFAQLLSCVWCLSVWVGLFFAITYFTLWYIAIWIAFPFALSAAAIVISKYLSK
jgi:hypothetical protein